MIRRTYNLYVHRNKENGRVFVERTCKHLTKNWGMFMKMHSHNLKLKKDLEKYGEEAFDHGIVAMNLSNYESKKLENEYIEKFDSIINGYNTRMNNLKNTSEIGPGRPSKDRSNKVMIGFESTLPLKLRLEDEAKTKKQSLSSIIREILERHFEER